MSISQVGITLNINMEGEYLVKGVAADGPANVVAADGLPVIQPADILEAVDGRGIHTLVCVCVCCVCARACVRVCAIHTHTHTHTYVSWAAPLANQN